MALAYNKDQLSVLRKEKEREVGVEHAPVHTLAKADIMETNSRGRVRPSILVLERLGKERIESGFVCAWVDVTY